MFFYSGLDFALLQKVRSEIVHRENAGDEEEYEEEIKGGFFSEDIIMFIISSICKNFPFHGLSY